MTHLHAADAGRPRGQDTPQARVVRVDTPTPDLHALVTSWELLRRPAQLAEPHPIIRAAITTTIAHTPTINSIIQAVLDLLIPQPTTAS